VRVLEALQRSLESGGTAVQLAASAAGGARAS
jgi:hypothetical protein